MSTDTTGTVQACDRFIGARLHMLAEHSILPGHWSGDRDKNFVLRHGWAAREPNQTREQSRDQPNASAAGTYACPSAFATAS